MKTVVDGGLVRSRCGVRGGLQQSVETGREVPSLFGGVRHLPAGQQRSRRDRGGHPVRDRLGVEVPHVRIPEPIGMWIGRQDVFQGHPG